jgi:SAM-dependent methyltransferase
MNSAIVLPTQRFLPKGGRVLDVGCGAGRTTIMIAAARPAAKIVALDNFSAGYIANHGPAKTLHNFEVAGFADRTAIERGDMRSLPFVAKSLDAVASSYAIDHLDPQEIPGVIRGVNRVLRPEGQFLLMVIVPNLWTAIAYGPMVHLSFPKRRFWRRAIAEANMTLEEEGSVGGTAYFLARKTAECPPQSETVGEPPKRSRRLILHAPKRTR